MRDSGVGRGAGQVSLWSRQVVIGWMLAVGVVSAVAFVVAGLVFGHFVELFLSLLAGSAAFLATGAVRVSVTREGVTVGSVVFPFLSRTIPASKIRSASARWTRPRELGGWGYRWTLEMRSVSLREGDALWLHLTNGKEFVVTVDDAEEAARIVNGLRA